MIMYVFGAIGLFLLLLGIGLYKSWLVEAIAGFDAKKDNKEIAGKWIGTNIILMGTIILLSSIILLLLNIKTPLIVFSIFMGSVIIFSLRSALLYNKKVR